MRPRRLATNKPGPQQRLALGRVDVRRPVLHRTSSEKHAELLDEELIAKDVARYALVRTKKLLQTLGLLSLQLVD